jgi:hypothetical protein
VPSTPVANVTIIVGGVSGTEAAKRDYRSTSRTAASLNSGEYLPRWLDTIRSIQLPQFYFGAPVRIEWGTSATKWGLSMSTPGELR